MHVGPIKGQKEEDLARGMIECLNTIWKKPEIVYTAEKGAMNKEAIQKYCKHENMEHHRTRAHPNFNERAIRTFKDMLYRRVEADEKKGKQKRSHGQVTYWKYYQAIIIKWSTRQRDLHQKMPENPVTNSKWK